MNEFYHLLEQVSADISAISGLECTWKDANPQIWTQLPLTLAQHRNEHCVKMKNTDKGYRVCSEHCNYPNPQAQQPYSCTCPFKIEELRIPLITQGRYIGTLSIGPWNDRDTQQMHALQRIISPLVKLLAARYSEMEQSTRRTNTDPRFQKCCAYIREHLHLQLRSIEVAAYLELSNSRFIHWFIESNGSGFKSYLQQEVLNQASQLLLNKRSITDIALDLGYKSASSFSAAFRSRYGQTPSAFRRNLQAQLQESVA